MNLIYAHYIFDETQNYWVSCCDGSVYIKPVVVTFFISVNFYCTIA